MESSFFQAKSPKTDKDIVQLRPVFQHLFLITVMAASLGHYTPARADQSTEEMYHARQWKPDESDRYVGDFVEERRLENLQYSTSYTPARQKFQDEILKDMVDAGKVSAKPRIIFTAGAYGSGKSTVLAALEHSGYYEGKDFIRIDPDAIKEKIPEYAEFKLSNPSMAPTLVHRESTYIADLAFERALASGKNIILDSSLKDTEHYRNLMERIRKTRPNYQIEIVGVNASRNRILNAYEARAKATGRIIPQDQIDESIVKAMASVDALTPMADRVLLVNTETINPILKEVRVNGKRVARNIQLIGPKARSSLMKAMPKREVRGTLPKHFKVSDFDLDWTTVSPLFEKPKVMDWRVVKVQGQYYRLSDYGEKVFKNISEHPDMKLAVWSKGTRSRNLEMLKRIQPPEWGGKSLYDVTARIFSKEDLVPSETGDEKILAQVSKNRSNVILVDDQLENIVGSRGKGIYLGKTYNFYETEEEVIAAQKSKLEDARYVPENLAEWRRDRNRLVGAYEIIMQSHEESKRTGKAFADLVAQKSLEPRDAYIEQGLKRLSRTSTPKGCLEQVLRNAF